MTFIGIGAQEIYVYGDVRSNLVVPLSKKAALSIISDKHTGWEFSKPTFLTSGLLRKVRVYGVEWHCTMDADPLHPLHSELV